MVKDDKIIFGISILCWVICIILLYNIPSTEYVKLLSYICGIVVLLMDLYYLKKDFFNKLEDMERFNDFSVYFVFLFNIIVSIVLFYIFQYTYKNEPSLLCALTLFILEIFILFFVYKINKNNVSWLKFISDIILALHIIMVIYFITLFLYKLGHTLGENHYLDLFISFLCFIPAILCFISFMKNIMGISPAKLCFYILSYIILGLISVEHWEIISILLLYIGNIFVSEDVKYLLFTDDNVLKKELSISSKRKLQVNELILNIFTLILYVFLLVTSKINIFSDYINEKKIIFSFSVLNYSIVCKRLELNQQNSYNSIINDTTYNAINKIIFIIIFCIIFLGCYKLYKKEKISKFFEEKIIANYKKIFKFIEE